MARRITPKRGVGGKLAEKIERMKLEGTTVSTHEKRPGLGDRIESALTSVGVTKESWGDFKEKFGLPRSCNCDARRDYINSVGEKLGSAAKSALARLFGG